jgi:hypothetical protein
MTDTTLTTAMRTALNNLKTNQMDLPMKPFDLKTIKHTTHNRPPSISKHTFDYIKAHPYVTKKQAVEELAKEGCPATTVYSMISHMVRQRLVSIDHLGKLTAIVKKFEPLLRPDRLTLPRETPKSGDIVMKYHVETPDVQPVVANLPAIDAYVNRETRTESLLNSLSVIEARALYLELHSMFGGK